MNRVLSLMMTFVAFVTSIDPGQLVQTARQSVQSAGETVHSAGHGVGEGIQKELVAIKHPVAETVVGVTFSQCDNVKKLFGISYEQLQGEKEPDVNSLSLVHKTREFTRTYNISSAAEALREAGAFNSRDKVVVFVHGFTDDPSSESFGNISSAFFDSDEGNNITLLALDGSPLIHWLYLRSTSYVIFIGQKLAEVLFTIVKNGLDPKQIHMVGHSLGAHISSFTGKQFYSLTGMKLSRISGLDPAGPCFAQMDPSYRLQASDADYVDVMHTDSGVLGIKSPVGHADYYPNGGEQQPNCFWQSCSHSRSWLYYAESIRQKHAFPARRCGSWQDFTEGRCSDEISYMGYGSEPGTEGLFYLQTADKQPFGLGAAGLNFTNNVGVVRNVQGFLGKVPVLKTVPLFN